MSNTHLTKAAKLPFGIKEKTGISRKIEQIKRDQNELILDLLDSPDLIDTLSKEDIKEITSLFFKAPNPEDKNKSVTLAIKLWHAHPQYTEEQLQTTRELSHYISKNLSKEDDKHATNFYFGQNINQYTKIEDKELQRIIDMIFATTQEEDNIAKQMLGLFTLISSTDNKSEIIANSIKQYSQRILTRAQFEIDDTISYRATYVTLGSELSKLEPILLNAPKEDHEKLINLPAARKITTEIKKLAIACESSEIKSGLSDNLLELLGLNNNDPENAPAPPEQA